MCYAQKVEKHTHSTHFKHNSYTSNEYLVKILLYLGVGILYSQLKLIQDTRYILVNLIAFLADNQISANILLPPHYKLSYVVSPQAIVQFTSNAAVL